MIFVYRYVIIPFNPQYLPKHVPLILQGAGCQRAGCQWLKTLNFPLLSSYSNFYDSLINEWTINTKKEPKLPSIALLEILWQNTCITLNYKPIFFKDFRAKGIDHVFHLFDSNGVLYKWSSFQDKQDLPNSLFMKWYQLCHEILEELEKHDKN